MRKAEAIAFARALFRSLHFQSELCYVRSGAGQWIDIFEDFAVANSKAAAVLCGPGERRRQLLVAREADCYDLIAAELRRLVGTIDKDAEQASNDEQMRAQVEKAQAERPVAVKGTVKDITAKQRCILQLLGRSGQMGEAELTRLCPRWRASMRPLERKQLVTFTIRHEIVWCLTKNATPLMSEIMG